MAPSVKPLGTATRTPSGVQKLAVKKKVVTKLKPAPEIRPSGVSGLLARQRTIAGARLKFSPSIATVATFGQLLKSRQQARTNQLDNQINKTKQKIVQVARQNITTSQKLQLRQKLNTELKQKLKSKSNLRTITQPKPRTPRIPPPILLFGKDGKIIRGPLAPKPQQGFNVFVKGQGKKKFIKANKVPVTRLKARDLGGFLIDHSLAATFRINKTSKNAQKPKLRIPTRYFSRNFPKFRAFKKRRGKKIVTPTQFIEVIVLKPHRL